ncbi:MAG: thiosulfate reductase [Bryobacterales bacterium]|nr:thiosulfate reductase [Bryobacterales bacterium]
MQGQQRQQTAGLEEKHKLATRWYHWINFPVLTVMIVSGMFIYWAFDPYRIGVGDFTLIHLFPNWFYDLTHIDRKLAIGMALHFLFAWLFAINGLLYVAYTLFSGEWRELVPDAKCFRQALDVVKHDLGLGPLPPQGRYNAAQRITYTAIVLMGGASLLTGLAIYKPVQIAWLTTLLGGYEWARWEHFWLTMGYIGFFVIHIAQVIRAGWPNLRSMISGYDLAKEKENTGAGRHVA